MNRLRVLLLLTMAWVAPVAYGQEAPEGIRPLIVLENPVKTVIPSGVIFLNEPQITEQFLEQLEGHPLDWKYLFGNNVDERYDRLFDESRKRDTQRVGNPHLEHSS